MGVIEDVMKALERIPIWKRVSALPAEVESLRARVAALEAAIAGGAADRCPVCKAPGFKVVSSKKHAAFGDVGVLQDTYRCGSCSHTEERERAPWKNSPL